MSISSAYPSIEHVAFSAMAISWLHPSIEHVAVSVMPISWSYSSLDSMSHFTNGDAPRRKYKEKDTKTKKLIEATELSAGKYGESEWWLACFSSQSAEQ